MRNKILILANNDVGLFNFRYELIDRLLNSDYEVHISLPYGPKVDKLKSIGCIYHETNMDRHGKNPYNEIKLYRIYKKIIKNVAPNCVLSYTIKPNIYGAIAANKLDIPFIANVTGLGTALENNNILQKIIITMYRYAFRNVEKIFFQNTSNKKFFVENKIINSGYDNLPGSGVNIEKFQLKDYPDDKGNLKFLTIGRIMKNKGIDELLDAAVELKKKYNDAISFYLVGDFDDQSYRQRIDKLVEEDVINYLGFRNDIDSLIDNSHCIIHPSYHEGLSNVLLEAGASGRPVIASDIPGCRETFIDGVSGLAVKVKDSNDLISKIEQFINLPYDTKKRMGKANREHVVKNFDRKIVVEKYIESIEKYAK